MLSLSDVTIEDKLRIFTKHGVEVAFLVPTPTGYDKSIMDATGPIRLLLEKYGLHSYTAQKQGPLNKKMLRALFVFHDRLVETQASLYRPITKNGDPRIWFGDLKKYCRPKNLLAIATNKKNIYVFNMSNPELLKSIMNSGFVEEIIKDISETLNLVADELLGKLNKIHRMGFIKTITAGSTGVGMTLEDLLGLKPNVRKIPDYKGIEVKGTRKIISRQNRVNLFSQVPNWDQSRIKNGTELVKQYGYKTNRGRELYCTVKAHDANPQGLYFRIDEDDEILYNKARIKGRVIDVVLWKMELLRLRLKEKHPETFWVKAVARGTGSREEFRYDEVIHTISPNSIAFSQLIDLKIISMDYTLSLIRDRTRDHGYLFKIDPKNLDKLFPPPRHHILI